MSNIDSERRANDISNMCTTNVFEHIANREHWDMYFNLHDAIEKLPEKIQNLFLKGLLLGWFDSKTPEKVKLIVDCNDLFFWGCADAEEFSEQDIPDLLKALDESPKHGSVLWCCRKRKMRPQAAYYKLFSAEEALLFDAMPVRTDSDGIKPQDRR